MREVRITAVMNGYIVTVGCQTLVFTTREEMLTELGRYLANPCGVEAEYIERFGQKPSRAGEAVGIANYDRNIRTAAEEARTYAGAQCGTGSAALDPRPGRGY